MESFIDMCSSPLLIGCAMPEPRLRSSNSVNSMDEFFNAPIYRDWPSQENFLLPEQREPEEQFILDLPEEEQREIKVFDLSRKVRRPHKKPDYKKNICGYVTKRSIRECLSETYEERVRALCLKHHCSYDQLHDYYLSKIEYVTGPRHLPMLLVPDSEAEVAFKAAFRQFFEWFIKQRYLRYLLNDGKMADKKAYIQFKNEVIAKYLNTVG